MKVQLSSMLVALIVIGAIPLARVVAHPISAKRYQESFARRRPGTTTDMKRSGL